MDQAWDWTDDRWRGIRHEDLLIYELHVGTATEDGTFDALIFRGSPASDHRSP